MRSSLRTAILLATPPAASGATMLPAPFSFVNGSSDGPAANFYEGWSNTYAGAAPSQTVPTNTPYDVDQQGFDESCNAYTWRSRFYETVGLRQRWPNNASAEAGIGTSSNWVYKNNLLNGAANHSNLLSPKPITNWANDGARAVVGNTISTDTDPIEVTTWHRNAKDGRQVAAVKFYLSDGTTTITVIVNRTTISVSPRDLNKVIVFRLPATDITALLDNHYIKVDCEVFAWVGEFNATPANSSIASSILDGNSDRSFCSRYVYKSTSRLANPPTAVVASIADGADGVGTPTASGVVSVAGSPSANLAAAKAAPFQTIKQALDKAQTDLGASTQGVDGLVIYVDDDTGTPYPVASVTSNITQRCGRVTIKRLPTSTSRANVRITGGVAVAQPKLGVSGTTLQGTVYGCIMFEDVLVKRSGDFAVWEGASAAKLEVRFRAVEYDNNAATTSPLGTGANTVGFVDGMLCTVVGNSRLGAAQAEWRQMRAIDIDMNALGSLDPYLVLGCRIKRPTVNSMTTGTTRGGSGAIIAFNEILQITALGAIMGAWGGTGSIPLNGLAICQNVGEWVGAAGGGGTFIAISNDNAQYANTHVVIHNNTFAGIDIYGRWNMMYDENSTPQFPRMSWLASFFGNVYPSKGTKSDIFQGTNNGNPEGFTVGSPSTRIGNFPYRFGCGCEYEWLLCQDGCSAYSISFAQDFPGYGASVGTNHTAPKNDPGFVVDGSTFWNGSAYATGPSSGDYRLQAAGAGVGFCKRAVLSHYIDGVARGTVNNVGACSTAP